MFPIDSNLSYPDQWWLVGKKKEKKRVNFFLTALKLLFWSLKDRIFTENDTYIKTI